MISFLTFSEISSGQTPNNCPNLYADCNNCQDCIKNKKVKKLIYDFECKMFYYNGNIVTSLDSVKLEKEESIILQIENVNRYIYNVEVDIAELKYTSEVPPIFSKLILGDGLALEDNSKGFLTSENDSEITELLALKSRINSSIEGLLKYQALALSICELKRPCCDKEEAINYSELMKLIKEFKLKSESYEITLKKNITEQKTNIDKRLIVQSNCSALSKQIDNEKEESKKNTLLVERNALNCYENDQKLSALKIDLVELEKKLLTLEIISKDIKAIKSEDILKLAVFAENYSAENYRYRIPLYFPTTSLTDFTIKISPIENSLPSSPSQMPLYNQSNSISVFQKGHWNVGFSTGPFFTVGKSLSDQRYVWKNQIETTTLGNDTTVLKLVKNDKRNRFMGLASTLNLNCQVTRSFSWGLSFGAGLSIEEKPRQNYLGGFNLSFGMSHPIVIGAGILTTRVDRFNDLIYGDPNLSYKEKSAIEYNRIWTTGGYLMVSYSITKVNKEKKASNK